MNRDFVYHNENPYKIEEQDCVCRAISKALDLDYGITEKLLKMSAEVNNCDTLCVCCYNLLLEDVFKLPVRYAKNNETVIDVAKMFPYNKVLIRIEGHLTVSDKGVVFDLWDCRNRLVDKYWIIPNKN